MAVTTGGLWAKNYIASAAAEYSARALIISWFEEHGDKVVRVCWEDIDNSRWYDDCNSLALRANVLQSLGFLYAERDLRQNDYMFKINQNGVDFFQKAIGL